MDFNKLKIGKKSYGLLLWFLVLCGYFLFIFNWVLMNKLQGSVGHNGWKNTFFTSNPSTTTTQAINYTITFMRGLGSILSGFVLAKFGHKKAVLITIGLLSVAFPTVALGYWHSEISYGIFVFGRMIMAIGGTVLIIYTQPIISKFFSPREKTVLSRTNSFGFNIGCALPLVLFLFPIVRYSMLNYWQIWAFVASGIPLILLTVYWFVASEIEIKKSVYKEEPDKDLKPATWSSVFKDKKTWPLSIYYGFWLVLVVAVILISPAHFAKLHSLNHLGKLKIWEVLLPIILFLIAFIPGIFLVGWFAKTNIDRRGYLAVCSLLSVLFIVAAYLSTAYIKSAIPTAIFMFFSGIFGWGVQGIVLNEPHEIKENSPQRVAITISFAWGFGYMIYTIVNVVLASIFDLISHNSTTNVEFATWTQFIVEIVFMLITVISALFLAKTKENKIKNIFSEFKRVTFKPKKPIEHI